MAVERRARNQNMDANSLTLREVNTLVGCWEKIHKIAKREGMYVLVKVDLEKALRSLEYAAAISDREFIRT